MEVEVVVATQVVRDQEVPLKVAPLAVFTVVGQVAVRVVETLQEAALYQAQFVLFGLDVQDRFHQLVQEMNNESLH